MMMVRPVFDPAIPVEVRDALLANAEGLRPGSGAPPVPPGGRRRIARDTVRALALGAVCALLPVVLTLTRMFGFTGRLIAAGGQVALLAVWLGGYLLGGTLWPGIIASLAVQLACTVGAFVFMDEWQLRRGIRRARGHYLVNDDFDPEGRALLARAQAAIAVVTGSGVAAAGLLDDAANDVVLPRQEWEIARALARQGGARSSPGGSRGPGRSGRDSGHPTLVAGRVEALERYAEQVRDADGVLSQRLGAPGTAPAESAALAEIEDLAENARRVGDAIRAAPARPGHTTPAGPTPAGTGHTGDATGDQPGATGDEPGGTGQAGSRRPDPRPGDR